MTLLFQAVCDNRWQYSFYTDGTCVATQTRFPRDPLSENYEWRWDSSSNSLAVRRLRYGDRKSLTNPHWQLLAASKYDSFNDAYRAALGSIVTST